MTASTCGRSSPSLLSMSQGEPAASPVVCTTDPSLPSVPGANAPMSSHPSEQILP